MSKRNIIGKNEIIINKSKFICYIFEIDNLNEISIIQDELKKEHKNARHICYGYKFKNENINTIKVSDDKEPKGTASKPILNYLQYIEKNNIAIFIIRYFGGVKLGVGGLYRAYSKVINETLKN